MIYKTQHRKLKIERRKFEDNKEVVKSCKSKDRQYSDKKEKGQKGKQ
jgi:hypothetical protein